MTKRSYYEIFQKRCYNRGLTFKQDVQSQVATNFDRFLKSSPNAIDVRVNNQGELIRVATLSDKEGDTLDKRTFLCRKEDCVHVGDFLYWGRSIWLVFQKIKDTINAYDKFECIECRHKVKWINKSGVLKETPCYLVAQTDEKIKYNFRTWNNMITPQPNKHMEIITARNDVELGQKFLVNETAWSVVESDYISVKDILYLSLTEDKKDLYVDDIENNIANIVDLNKFELIIQENDIALSVGDTYQLNGKVYLNGVLFSEDLIMEILEGAHLVSVDDNMKLTAKETGAVRIRLFLEDHCDVFQDLTIVIKETAQEPVVTYELRGDSSIKWGRTKTYQLIKTTNGVDEPVECTFTIEDPNGLLINTSLEITGIAAMISANDKNKVGNIKLVATLGEITLEKEISIVSLWM